jgi:hypothetical protein
MRELPELWFLVRLHAVVAFPRHNRSNTDRSAVRIQRYGVAFRRVAVCHSKAELHIPSRRAANMHEVLGLFSIRNKDGLINGMVDDELIADQVIGKL